MKLSYKKIENDMKPIASLCWILCNITRWSPLHYCSHAITWNAIHTTLSHGLNLGLLYPIRIFMHAVVGFHTTRWWSQICRLTAFECMDFTHMHLFQITIAETNISRQQVSCCTLVFSFSLFNTMMHRILSCLLLLLAVVSAAPGPSVYNPEM